MEKELTKVKDLTPQSKQVNVLAKVLNIGEQKEIQSRFGEARKLAEATVGDETGTVVLTLWEDQIAQVAQNDVVLIDNGYVSLVRGHMRLNVGKYGSIVKSEQDVPEVNTQLDVSAPEYEREPRYRSGGYDRDRGGGRREFNFGTERGGRDRDSRGRGRRRF